MKVALNNALSFYLTGRTKLPEKLLVQENNTSSLTQQELDDLEISSNEEYRQAEDKSFRFENPALNLKADFNTVSGQFRMSGLGIINSFFSGIGVEIGKKVSIVKGLGLAATSFATTLFKDVPFLSRKFSIMGFGGNLIRGPLHIFDSIFSTVGEKCASYKLPGLLAGGLSLFSLNQSLNSSRGNQIELPFDTLSGTLGRTAIHHMDSMLASKAAQLSQNNSSAGSFSASLFTTLGLLLPPEIKKKKIPWNTANGFIAQGGSHYIDSLFSGLGNIFSKALQTPRNIALGASGILIGAPVLGTLLSSVNYQIPFGTLEGRLARSIFHMPESFAFNAGNVLGDSFLGVPLSLGFLGLTYLTCLSKQKEKILKNFNISRDKIGGMIQRLPFHLMYSIISASGVKLSKLIPAPVLFALGPLLSFKIGEKFKNIDAKFDDFKGLMLRNSVHLWETILARSAYQTGKILANTGEESVSSGSILSDGRWLSDDGRIVPSMAVGKQINELKENNFFKIVLSSLGGIALAFGLHKFVRNFLESKAQTISKQALVKTKHPEMKVVNDVLVNNDLMKPRILRSFVSRHCEEARRADAAISQTFKEFPHRHRTTGYSECIPSQNDPAEIIVLNE